MRFSENKIKIDKSSILKRSMIDPHFIQEILSESNDIGEWIEIEQGKLIEIQRNKIKNNPSLQKLDSFINSSLNWAKSGFELVDSKILEERKKKCNSCDFWDSNAFRGTGKCKKCGCSTWAKLKMATERCPIGKWEAVDKEKIIVEQDK